MYAGSPGVTVGVRSNEDPSTDTQAGSCSDSEDILMKKARLTGRWVDYQADELKGTRVSEQAQTTGICIQRPQGNIAGNKSRKTDKRGNTEI